MGNSVHKAMSSLNAVIAFEHNYKRLQHRHSHKLECMAHMAWKMKNDQILSPAHHLPNVVTYIIGIRLRMAKANFSTASLSLSTISVVSQV